MPPDADKLRQRKGYGAIDADDINEPAVAPPALTTMQPTKVLKGNEVSIEGVIYDIADFDHPGGETIKIFGGNDVTAHYKMIHPYHTSKHLEKLKRVGTVAGYKPEYKFSSDFEKELKREVFKIVNRGREFGTPGYFARVAVYVSIFAYLQYRWMMGPTSYALAIIFGISMATIGLNVQHDANHGAASRKVWVNDLLGLGADFIGGCKWLWMEKHWTHHAYTNHTEKDPDGFSAEPFLLFNEYDKNHEKRSWYHAYQAFYFFFILSGYWISAVLNVAEVWDLKDRGAGNVGVSLDNAFISSRAKCAFSIRILYLFMNFGMPLYRNPHHWLTTLGHIYVMGVAGSLALGMLFTLSHNFENAERDPTAVTRKTGEPVCWYKAQVETSSTYGGTIAGWLTGGLNFQIEHHLFPRMSSAWYPVIAPKVREVCKKHGVRYVYYPWVHQNMISTLRYTHAIGNASSHWTNHNPLKGDM